MNLNLKEKIKFQDLYYYNSIIKNDLEIKIKEINTIEISLIAGPIIRNRGRN